MHLITAGCVVWAHDAALSPVRLGELPHAVFTTSGPRSAAPVLQEGTIAEWHAAASDSRRSEMHHRAPQARDTQVATEALWPVDLKQ